MVGREANIYLIKDLSRLSGHSVYTLKFYLKLGLIKESGRSPETRFRYFDETTLARVSKIRAWRREGKSLSDIAERLNGNGVSPQALRTQETTHRPENPQLGLTQAE